MADPVLGGLVTSRSHLGSWLIPKRFWKAQAWIVAMSLVPQLGRRMSIG